MGQVLRYMPINNPDAFRTTQARLDPQDAGMDGYERDAMLGFLGCGNDSARLLRSGLVIRWATTMPAGSEAFQQTVATSTAVQAAIDAVDKKGPSRRLYGTLSETAPDWRRDAPRRALAGLTASDVLYVVGHGSWRGGFLVHEENLPGKDETYDSYYLRADMLGRALLLEGLPTTHVYVKLNMCYGGGAEGVPNSFAQMLARALGTLGYGSIQVGGYQHALRHTPASEKTATQEAGPPTTTRLVGIMAQGRRAMLAAFPGTDLPRAYTERANPSASQLMYEADPFRCWYGSRGQMLRWNAPDMPGGFTGQLLATDESNADYMAWFIKSQQQETWTRELKSKGLA